VLDVLFGVIGMAKSDTFCFKDPILVDGGIFWGGRLVVGGCCHDLATALATPLEMRMATTAVSSRESLVGPKQWPKLRERVSRLVCLLVSVDHSGDCGEVACEELRAERAASKARRGGPADLLLHNGISPEAGNVASKAVPSIASQRTSGVP
jgi:hypothetical protein